MSPRPLSADKNALPKVIPSLNKVNLLARSPRFKPGNFTNNAHILLKEPLNTTV